MHDRKGNRCPNPALDEDPEAVQICAKHAARALQLVAEHKARRLGLRRPA
jgi:hypothetical protein